MTRRIFCKVLLVVVTIFGLLVLSGVLSAQGRSEDAFDRVRDVQERNTDWLMAIDGVEGTAIGFNQNDQLTVKVFTAASGVRDIPRTLEGVPVQVVVTGKFYALSHATGRFPRPVPTGVSTGHPAITAGTIGCRVTDGTYVYALSNNHVYANSNKASIRDAVIQPGTFDGGSSPADDIGTLFDFEPIVFSTSANNVIDAAIALSSTSLLGNATPSDGYGTPSSTTATARLRLKVQKYGRTTGLTNGRVSGINATVNIGYSSGTARFVNQIVISPGGFSAGGDSGSLIVTKDGKKPVGLLFAGSLISTIANPIDAVLSAFGVTVDDSEGPPPSDNDPPVVSISSPLDGSTFDPGASISFAGTATDTEDDDATLTIVWTSSIDNQIGIGGSFTTTLSDGNHTITATVTDSEAKSASDSISITVGTPPNTFGLTVFYATEGGKSGDKHLLVTFTATDGGGVTTVSDVSFSHTLNNDTGGSWGPVTGTTGADGTVTFTLKNAPGGTYSVTVHWADHDTLAWDRLSLDSSFTKKTGKGKEGVIYGK